MSRFPPALALAVVAALPLMPGPGRAQAGPVGVGAPSTPPRVVGPDLPPGDPRRPPDGGSGGGSGLGSLIAPSLSFNFTLGGRPKAAQPQETEQAPDTVVFILRDPMANLQALAQAAGVTVVETALLESLQLVMVVGRIAPPDTPQAAIERLSLLPQVAWAQPDHLYSQLATPAPLPRAFELQGLDAGRMATAATGLVAMIDTPVALNHEALRGAAIQQRLFNPAARAGGHGTTVAALLVGQESILGPGRGARLVSLAAFQPAVGDGPSMSQTRYLAKALDAAAVLRPDVLNLSFGGPGDRLLEALIAGLDAKGVCMVAAAGNGGPSGRAPFPASHPAVLGVTAVDERLRIYPRATRGAHVDVAAIGVDLVAAVPGGYRRMSGTSLATAFVSGALLRLPACSEAHSPIAMRVAVAGAARDLGRRGRDEVFGAGLFQFPAGLTQATTAPAGRN